MFRHNTGLFQTCRLTDNRRTNDRTDITCVARMQSFACSCAMKTQVLIDRQCRWQKVTTDIFNQQCRLVLFVLQSVRVGIGTSSSIIRDGTLSVIVRQTS